MALALLTQDWARARGGFFTALTVDHGLRPEAADEAAQVARWCAQRGIAHDTMRREAAPLTSGIQAAARAARYRLLEEWCRARCVLHLLVAHQREDQAETLLMRLMRGSGATGLAGMAALREGASVRVLRPVLGVPRARLAATLEAAGQGWIDDPSNRNPAYLRPRLRAAMGGLAARGFPSERLTAIAAGFGRSRAAREAECASLLARCVTIAPAGFAWLDGMALVSAPGELGVAALGALLATVSGSDYPPRLERLTRLHRFLASGLAGGRTLGGCLIRPCRGRLLVCREPAAAAPPVSAVPGVRARWDGRFTLDLDRAAPAGLSLGALGNSVASVLAEASAARLATVPPAARPALPAIRDAMGVVAVPALGYFCSRRPFAAAAAGSLVFRPVRPLTGARFTIV